jgi:hypothetical protein
MNFNFDGNPQDHAMNIARIQDVIDFHLAGSPGPVNKYKGK